MLSLEIQKAIALQFLASNFSRKFPPAEPTDLCRPNRFFKMWRKGKFAQVWQIELRLEAEGGIVVNLNEVSDPAEIARPTPEKSPSPSNGEDGFLRDVIKKYETTTTLFQPNTGLPPSRGKFDFRIELISPDIEPRSYPLRPLNQEELNELKTQVNGLLEKGWIRHSNSPWGAPSFFFAKTIGAPQGEFE